MLDCTTSAKVVMRLQFTMSRQIVFELFKRRH